jgi:hypothetical protein
MRIVGLVGNALDAMDTPTSPWAWHRRSVTSIVGLTPQLSPGTAREQAPLQYGLHPRLESWVRTILSAKAAARGCCRIALWCLHWTGSTGRQWDDRRCRLRLIGVRLTCTDKMGSTYGLKRQVRSHRKSPSCQLLAQTTHDYMFTKKGGKAALEHARQGVQRVKLDTDQPSMLPAQHAGHGGHFLQQTH